MAITRTIDVQEGVAEGLAIGDLTHLTKACVALIGHLRVVLFDDGLHLGQQIFSFHNGLRQELLEYLVIETVLALIGLMRIVV